MFVRPFITASLFTLAFVAGLGQAQPPSTDGIETGHYAIEPYHTQVVFSLSHFGFTEFTGLFSGASGTLDFDPAAPKADKLDITVPVSSVLTTSTQLNEELKGGQWFDAAQFPNAHFLSTDVKRFNATDIGVSGTLTLHGVSKPVVLKAHLVGAGINPLNKSKNIGFSATTTIKRSDFGVNQYVPMVGDDVRLTIAAGFVQQ
ncbi:YceI family protein [Paraburkholderia sp. BL17N1]|uniref:YceI family protein n=1 Tax=Paraburkholderia sp. BL17N1 TaxID=1938798 RepID=UPI000EAE7ADE|nr:YceI family protein [Paraburkholderia sp. BL17N1]RKR31333.1 polyisoprenoid-binding protein YceI [Paraburkholderia sp. BL17N1]